MRFASLAFAALFGVALVPAAHADLLFSQLPDYAQGAFSSNVGSNQQEADNFSLSQKSTVTDIKWWGVYGSAPVTDNFTFRLFADDGGKPATNALGSTTAVLFNRTDTGNKDGSNEEVYAYTASLSNAVTLNAGTTYYLSILDNTNNNWAWQEDGGGDHWTRQGDTAWTKSGIATNLAFQLIGTAAPVPELSTFIGFGSFVFLGGLAAFRQRKQARVDA